LSHYPDGELASTCQIRLVGEILDDCRKFGPDGLIVFDPSGVTGHPDHAAVTAAAVAAADLLDMPVLGWTLPTETAAQLNRELGTSFHGHPRTRSTWLSPSIVPANSTQPADIAAKRCPRLFRDYRPFTGKY